MYGFPPPTIHCTPPTDPAFLTTAGQAFERANELLTGDMAVLVGTMVRIRWDYPKAAIVAVSFTSTDGSPNLVWLISRDGWAEIAAPPQDAPPHQDSTDGAADEHSSDDRVPFRADPPHLP